MRDRSPGRRGRPLETLKEGEGEMGEEAETRGEACETDGERSQENN